MWGPAGVGRPPERVDQRGQPICEPGAPSLEDPHARGLGRVSLPCPLPAGEVGPFPMLAPPVLVVLIPELATRGHISDRNGVLLHGNS